jgi:hypothetical protein
MSDQSNAARLCGAQSASAHVPCLLAVGHAGPHRWWDKEGILTWVPHTESWRAGCGENAP